MKKGIVAGIIGVVSFASGFILGGKILVSMINDYKKRMERNLANMMLFNDWLEFLYSGGSVVQYFKSRGYKKIMILPTKNKSRTGSGHIFSRISFKNKVCTRFGFSKSLAIFASSFLSEMPTFTVKPSVW